MLESIKEYIRRQFDRYDEKKSTAVQVVEELPSDVENRVYITEDDRVYAKDIELQQANSAVLTVNEQEMDENQNITVDGSNTKATYEEENDFIDNLLPKVGAVKEVETLPAVPDKRVYIDKDGKVYAKDIELQKVEDAVKSVNEQTADENGNITVDGSNTEATYEGEKDFIDNLLPKVGTVKTVDELPIPIDDRMYIVGSRVFAKLIELLTKEEAEETFIPLEQKGAAEGVATLDINGKVPVTQLPSALLEYMGVWNAENNTPELSNDTVTEENKGNVYICNVAGTWNGIEFHAGDWIICNGVKWDKSTADDLVKSVNGLIGIVELDGSNVKATYEDETDFINNLLPKIGKVKAVNEQQPDDQGNITVDGSNTKATYEGETDYIDNLLPKLGKVKTVNEEEPDDQGNITVDGDNINVVYEDEEDTLNNTLPKLGKVKTVDDHEPDENGNVQLSWIGTKAEWEALDKSQFAGKGIIKVYFTDTATHELVDKVKIGEMGAVTSNAVAKAMSYSTEEVKTGAIWVDGRPIYRKCYKITLRTGLVTIDTIANVNTYLGCKGSYISSSNNKLAIPWIGASAQEYTDILIDASGNVRTTSNLTGTNCVIIIEYTKTTDTPTV